MRKLFLLFLMFFVSASLFAFDNLSEAPTDIGSLFTYIFANYKAVAGAGTHAVIAFAITIIIAIFKWISTVKTWFDKLGAWKFLIPSLLGIIAELIFNLPAQVTFASIVGVIITGATGTGLMSIGIHHFIENFKKK